MGLGVARAQSVTQAKSSPVLLALLPCKRKHTYLLGLVGLLVDLHLAQEPDVILQRWDPSFYYELVVAEDHADFSRVLRAIVHAPLPKSLQFSIFHRPGSGDRSCDVFARAL